MLSFPPLSGSAPKQFDGEVISPVGLIHEVELSTVLLAGKCQSDSAVEITESSQYLTEPN
jgi:hypothetical protein